MNPVLECALIALIGVVISLHYFNTSTPTKRDPVVQPNSLYNVDFCILMDCTGSMSPWITTTKEKINLVLEEVRKQYNNANIRYAFVGYRDYGDGPIQFEVMDFTEDVSQIQKFVAGISAQGGGDTPEDVFGGLEKVLSLNWKHETRSLIHFADAPGHGRFYHETSDNHPHFDSDGKKGRELMHALVNQNIQYTICRLEKITDIMISKFKEFYNEHGNYMLTIVDMVFERRQPQYRTMVVDEPISTMGLASAPHVDSIHEGVAAMPTAEPMVASLAMDKAHRSSLPTAAPTTSATIESAWMDAVTVSIASAIKVTEESKNVK
jgi:hypothetical protein